MNFDALGNLGDFVGGVGVIVTLVYLAVQVRRNTGAMLQASYLQNLSAAMQYGQLVGASTEAASVMRRGCQDFASLSEDEQFQFNGLMVVVFCGFEGQFYSWRQRFHSNEWWEPIRRNIWYLMRQPGVRAWWDTFPLNMNPEFTHYVLEQANASETTPAAQKGAAADEPSKLQ